MERRHRRERSSARILSVLSVIVSYSISKSATTKDILLQTNFFASAIEITWLKKRFWLVFSLTPTLDVSHTYGLLSYLSVQ